MKTTIDTCIADLLYNHDTVIVPGLGTFSLTYKSADIDPVQGKMQPPTKSIAFDASVAADDGLFIETLSRKLGQSEEKSRQILQTYIETQKAKLKEKEIFIIDKVGRLYVDFEDKLQFLPDTTNFNTDTFGLPAVTAVPTPKPTSTPTPTKPVATASAKAAPMPVKAPVEPNPVERPSFIRRNLGLIIGIAIVLVIAVIFALAYQRFFGDQTNDPTANLPEERTNVAPPPNEPEEITRDEALDFPAESMPDPIDNDLEEDGAENDNTANGQDDYEDSATEAVTPPPNQKSVVIAIGVFSNPDNVDKLVQRIYKTGYEPYLQESNGRTRVGLQLSYTNQSEVQTALRVARDEFAKDAFIMKQ